MVKLLFFFLEKRFSCYMVKLQVFSKKGYVVCIMYNAVMVWRDMLENICSPIMQHVYYLECVWVC